MKRSRLSSGLVVIGLVVASCGGDDDSADTTAAPAAPATTAAPAAPGTTAAPAAPGTTAAPAAPATTAAPAAPDPNAPPCSAEALAGMSPAERQAALVAGAEEEGEVSLYSSVNDDINTAWSESWDVKYPNIEWKLLQMGGLDNYTRTVTEERAGSHNHDININAGVEIGKLHNEGFLSDNPGIVPDSYPDDFFGEYWAATDVLPVLVVWNTDLVSDDEAPKTYDELLDPKWKGKVSIDANPGEFVAAMILDRGTDAAEEFVRTLVEDNEAQVRLGHTNQTQLLAAGEFSVSTELYAYRVEGLIQNDGAPLAYRGVEPIPLVIAAAAVSSNAPNPCAAILAFEHIVSDEAQQQVADVGRIPGSSTVDLLYPQQASLLAQELSVISPEVAADIEEDIARIVKITSEKVTG